MIMSKEKKDRDITFNEPLFRSPFYDFFASRTYLQSVRDFILKRLKNIVFNWILINSVLKFVLYGPRIRINYS